MKTRSIFWGGNLLLYDFRSQPCPQGSVLTGSSSTVCRTYRSSFVRCLYLETAWDVPSTSVQLAVASSEWTLCQLISRHLRRSLLLRTNTIHFSLGIISPLYTPCHHTLAIKLTHVRKHGPFNIGASIFDERGTACIRGTVWLLCLCRHLADHRQERRHYAYVLLGRLSDPAMPLIFTRCLDQQG
jgi:hypothetical protein